MTTTATSEQTTRHTHTNMPSRGLPREDLLSCVILIVFPLNFSALFALAVGCCCCCYANSAIFTSITENTTSGKSSAESAFQSLPLCFFVFFYTHICKHKLWRKINEKTAIHKWNSMAERSIHLRVFLNRDSRRRGGHGIFFTRWLPKTSANSLNTVFHSFQHTSSTLLQWT